MPLLILIGAAIGVAALLRLVYGAGHLSVDAMWALQWGNDLTAGRTLATTNGTTPHPGANLLGALADLAGRDADLWLSATTFLGAGVLVVATGVVAERLAGRAAAVAAGVIIATRPELLASTTAGMLDIWAAALICSAVAVALPGRTGEPARPLGAAGLLIAAGLLRPEAWALGLAWWAWCAWEARALRPIHLALAVAAPVLWVAHDLVFTGDALFAIHQTDLAAGILRQHQGIATGTGADLKRAVRETASALRAPLAFAALIAAAWLSRMLREGNRESFDRRTFGLVWATLGIFTALLLLQAATGTLIFSRFALLVAALASALVTATAVRAAEAAQSPRWSPAWVAAGVGLVVALNAVGPLHRTRQASHRDHIQFANARAALRPGVPCGPLASFRAGFSIYASRWTGLPLDQILENQKGPLTTPASYVDIDGDAAKALLRDFRPFPPINAAGARVVATSPGWRVTTTCLGK